MQGECHVALHHEEEKESSQVDSSDDENFNEDWIHNEDSDDINSCGQNPESSNEEVDVIGIQNF